MILTASISVRRVSIKCDGREELKKMDTNEIQARATIAAALITSHAVEVPTIPRKGDWSTDDAALRLRELTDYVYRVITTP